MSRNLLILSQAAFLFALVPSFAMADGGWSFAGTTGAKVDLNGKGGAFTCTAINNNGKGTLVLGDSVNAVAQPKLGQNIVVNAPTSCKSITAFAARQLPVQDGTAWTFSFFFRS